MLTRFNLPTPGVEGLIRAREGWLRDRVALFERYCAPSVASQTAPVTWLVYLDPASPDWLLSRLASYVDSGLFRPVFRTQVSPEELVADIDQAVPARQDILITTNIDNDDGIAADFSERLQNTVSAHERVAVYVSRGLVKRGEDLYLRTDPRNAFCSVREPWSAPVAAWSEYHNEFSRVMPVIEIEGDPGWLQVVHGNNVSNRVRGRRVSPHRYRELFPGLLDDVRDPSLAELARDRWVRRPVREARDGARAMARVAGLKVLGKERYGQAKLKISAALRRGQ